MKKSLATLGPPRRDLRPNMPNNRRTSPKSSSSASIQKNLHHTRQQVQKPSTTTYEQKYRNKNLNAIPTPLLVTISGLSVLDLSHNKLNDSQIELVMNSCTKLVSLCIQGNINTIIPAAIWKLKELANFKHDWLKFINYGGEYDENYQGQQKLKKIKAFVQKPDMVVKVNRIVGLDFEVYSRQIGHITLDYALMQKVDKSDCSSIAKQAMIKIIKEIQNSKNKAKPKMKPIMEKDQFLACTAVCGFDNNRHRRQQKPGSVMPKRQAQSTRQQSQTDTETSTKNIKISDIRQISSLSQSTDLRSEREIGYNEPGMVLHQLMATFDSNPSAPSQIDALLLKGYNPNQYDSNGLSPYHVCLIHNQKKGFQYLINISGNNPGFFDLEMGSHKECRNILHYSVFLKNFYATKLLVDFGLPIDRRDSSGARITHLVDQNMEFMLLLKKLIRKTTAPARAHGVLNTVQNKKKYVKVPQRAKQESKFRIIYSKNQKILQMFQSAVGFPVQPKNS